MVTSDLTRGVGVVPRCGHWRAANLQFALLNFFYAATVSQIKIRYEIIKLMMTYKNQEAGSACMPHVRVCVRVGWSWWCIEKQLGSSCPTGFSFLFCRSESGSLPAPPVSAPPRLLQCASPAPLPHSVSVSAAEAQTTVSNTKPAFILRSARVYHGGAFTEL